MNATNNLTRRAALRTMTTAAAATIPVVAAAALADDADRELLDWGAKFDALEAVFQAERQREREHLDLISDDMDVPMRAIMRLPAKTPAGLAVKARAARFACEHYWGKAADADWDHLNARALIDAVLQFTAA